jgi:hypothetical protein
MKLSKDYINKYCNVTITQTHSEYIESRREFWKIIDISETEVNVLVEHLILWPFDDDNNLTTESNWLEATYPNTFNAIHIKDTRLKLCKKEGWCVEITKVQTEDEYKLSKII